MIFASTPLPADPWAATALFLGTLTIIVGGIVAVVYLLLRDCATTAVLVWLCSVLLGGALIFGSVAAVAFLDLALAVLHGLCDKENP